MINICFFSLKPSVKEKDDFNYFSRQCHFILFKNFNEAEEITVNVKLDPLVFCYITRQRAYYIHSHRNYSLRNLRVSQAAVFCLGTTHEYMCNLFILLLLRF